MAAITSPEQHADIAPSVPKLIKDALRTAEATQFCKFIGDLTAAGEEFAIEAWIGPARRRVGGEAPRQFCVKLLLPKTFPFDVAHVVPVDPPLRWYQHQEGDWPVEIAPHANVLCPPKLSEVATSELLLPYLRHAYNWIVAALDGRLIAPEERFEFPHIAVKPNLGVRFLVEGGGSLFSFVTEHKRGLSLLSRVTKSDGVDVFRVTSLMPAGRVDSKYAWESTLRRNVFGNEEDVWVCPWVYAGSPIVELPHRPPISWEDFPRRLQFQILRGLNEASNTNTPVGFILLAFGVPSTWNGTATQIVWQCLKIEEYDSTCFMVPNGFRPNRMEFWPKIAQFKRDNSQLQWVNCDDVSPAALRVRGSGTTLSRTDVCIVGAGALGAMIARSLAKEELGRLVIVDPQMIVPGNVIRHESDFADVYENKADIVDARSLPLQKACKSHSLVADVISDWHKIESIVSRCQLIIDATGDHGVHDFLGNHTALGPTRLAWCFMTPGPEFAMLAMRSEGSNINLSDAERAIDESLAGTIGDTWRKTRHEASGLVWPEPGCYHPTFRASYHRVRMMADGVVGSLLAWLETGAKDDIATLYHQASSENLLGQELRIVKQLKL